MHAIKVLMNAKKVFMKLEMMEEQCHWEWQRNREWGWSRGGASWLSWQTSMVAMMRANKNTFNVAILILNFAESHSEFYCLCCCGL